MGNIVTKSRANWEVEAERIRNVRQESIQDQWLLPQEKIPPPDQFRVQDIPQSCGLLSTKDLAITASDATALVQKMSTGEWSAEEVTVAFLKRATIGHQLVSYICS